MHIQIQYIILTYSNTNLLQLLRLLILLLLLLLLLVVVVVVVVVVVLKNIKNDDVEFNCIIDRSRLFTEGNDAVPVHRRKNDIVEANGIGGVLGALNR